MAKLLDLDGVKILWNKIKALIDSKITTSESNITNNLQQYITTNLGANITQVVNKWMQDNKAEITKIVTQEVNKQITQIDDKINTTISQLKRELESEINYTVSQEISKQLQPYIELIQSIRNDVLRQNSNITRLEQSINTINNNVDSIVNTAIDKKIKTITNESINPIIQ
jgi:hypothetical protein|nr:MAG TPA: hypothetical protein [Crassvirales sp.]